MDDDTLWYELVVVGLHFCMCVILQAALSTAYLQFLLFHSLLEKNKTHFMVSMKRPIVLI